MSRAGWIQLEDRAVKGFKEWRVNLEQKYREKPGVKVHDLGTHLGIEITKEKQEDTHPHPI